MSKRLVMLALGLMLGIGVGYVYAGGPIFGNPITLSDNTGTNSPGVQVASLLPTPFPTLILSNQTTLSATTALTFSLQWSINGTNNPVTVATWNPPSTAPGQYTMSLQPTAVVVNQTIYATNTNSGGVTFFLSQQ